MDNLSHAIPVEKVRLSDDGRAVVILDQTMMPDRTETRVLTDAESLREATHHLRVRGAPAIGICAGYGMYLPAQQSKTECVPEFFAKLQEAKAYLDAARPAAVNLSWATARMVRRAEENARRPVAEIVRLLGGEARRIQAEDIEICRAISEYGLSLLHDGEGVLTHCNTGPLILGHERGMRFRVFAGETRPLLQGARPTAYKLSRGVST